MTVGYELNGQALDHMARGRWGSLNESDPLAGGLVVNNWREHIWESNVLPDTEFNLLFNAIGTWVILKTIAFDDPNGALTTYYRAKLQGVKATHDGPVFRNVTATFMVFIL